LHSGANSIFSENEIRRHIETLLEYKIRDEPKLIGSKILLQCSSNHSWT
jgi:hypothetical protein